MVKWISDIWTNFDSILIRDSFDLCGITSATDLHDMLDKAVHQGIVMDDSVEEETVAERRYRLLEPETSPFDDDQ